MDNLIKFILLSGGIFLIFWILRRLKGILIKYGNQKFYLKTEYEEGQKLLSEPFEIETTATTASVMEAISTYVFTGSKLKFINPHLYKTGQGDRWIAYSYGTRLYPHLFDVKVVIKNRPSKNLISVELINWSIYDGILSNQAEIQLLYKQVKEAVNYAEASSIV